MRGTPSAPLHSSSPGRVVVTLTGSGGTRLVALAQESGWQAALWPGLTFGPVTGGEAELAASKLDECRWLVLTSPQGARSLMASCEKLGLGSALNRVQLAAVGEGTAQALADWGRAADFVPTQADARTLAAQLPIRTGERVLHVTGQDSRDRLGRDLGARGAVYRRVNLYRSCAAHFPPEARHDMQQADWVVVASGVAVRGLAAQLGTSLPLLAMGRQTAQAAAEAGFSRVQCAREPSVQGVLATLNETVPG